MPHRERGDTVLLRLGNRDLHRMAGDHLSYAIAGIEHGHRALIADDVDAGFATDDAGLEPLEIPACAQHAVRLMVPQVRLHLS